MKSRWGMTFEIMLKRRRRIDRVLRDQLALQIREHAALEQQVADKQVELDLVTGELDANDAQIEKLLVGRGPLCIADLIGYRQYRDVILERHRGLAAELGKLRDGLASQLQKMAQTRSEIMKNDGKIKLCEKRIAVLKLLLARTAENLQDEEAQENSVGRRSAAAYQARSAR